MRGSLACLAFVALPACGPLLGLGDFHTVDAPGTGIDGASDGAPPIDAAPLVDVPDGPICYGTFVPICFASPLVGTVTIDAPIDTDDDPRCREETQTDGSKLCVISGGSIIVTGNVLVSGSRPLVLVADAIDVIGTLDASSHHTGSIVGAAASSSSCPMGTLPKQGGGGGNNGGGGGAGGSFNGLGANGGRGSVASAEAGVAGAAQLVTLFRGGCAGQAGANGGGGTPGIRGNSGGAVGLVSRGTISIAGSVFASGAGGGGTSKAGGGGGGSGGLIVFDASNISVTGIVAANGGAGGGDGDAQTGAAGGDGSTTMFDQVAVGGSNNGDSHGGDGGNGGASSIAPTVGQSAGSGSGAGGGAAVGYILVHGNITGTRISPAPTPF